ncbi:hypothetical protein NPIL_132691 [Nephila pilipes]|uniref:Uncharacterized protein n=1 Tax=Nephila pilipes TaxID=299642 RepID=A0A8X6P3Z0_NEPPI|nr:hypothetical protein NPIL_132691 [Nephila pilipes]
MLPSQHDVHRRMDQQLSYTSATQIPRTVALDLPSNKMRDKSYLDKLKRIGQTKSHNPTVSTRREKHHQSRNVPFQLTLPPGIPQEARPGQGRCNWLERVEQSFTLLNEESEWENLIERISQPYSAVDSDNDGKQRKDNDIKDDGSKKCLLRELV